MLINERSDVYLPANLEIAMCNADVVEVLDGEHHLPEVFPRVTLRKPTKILDSIEELSASQSVMVLN